MLHCVFPSLSIYGIHIICVPHCRNTGRTSYTEFCTRVTVDTIAEFALSISNGRAHERTSCYNGTNHITNAPALLPTAGGVSQDGVSVMTSSILSPETPQLKRCSRCHEWKPFEAFSRDKSMADGLRHYCKACISARYRENPEPHKKRASEWNKANPEKYKVNRKRHYAAHAEAANSAARTWQSSNPDRNRSIQRRASHARRARQYKAGGAFTSIDIEAIRVAQGNRCYICHKKLTKYHIDHFIPLVLGGSNDPGNLRLACPHCNQSKHAKHPFELGILI
jgi:5-methylcytosine-specific restriction endonuclease McrA